MGTVPGRVETLDECFILMRRSRPVVGSYDLGGFHFYGPDLCLQAELLGGSAHVTWTDFKRVTPYNDRFVVELGELKVLDF